MKKFSEAVLPITVNLLREKWQGQQWQWWSADKVSIQRRGYCFAECAVGPKHQKCIFSPILQLSTCFLFLPSWLCLYRSMLTPISSPDVLSWTALIWVCAATGGDIALINKPAFSWDQQPVHCWSAVSSDQSEPTRASVVLASVSVSACLFLSLSLCLSPLHAKSKTKLDF